MSGSEIKKPEEYHSVNSYIIENGESNGGISIYPEKHKTASLKPQFGVKRTLAFYVAFVSVIINLALIIVLISLSVRARGPSPVLPTCPVATCPNGWVGYQGKCYYFAKEERNWTSSKEHCSSLNASLAVVDSQEEMDFMMRYKGDADHWIGLERNQSQPWTWISGTVFNGWFTVLGGGNCAYMNHLGIASFSCSNKEPFICSDQLSDDMGNFVHQMSF